MIRIVDNIKYHKVNREDRNDENTERNERVYHRIKNASARVKLKYNRLKGYVEVSGSPDDLQFKILTDNRDRAKEQEILEEFIGEI